MGRTLLLCAKRTQLIICATVAILWNCREEARAGREASYSAQETSVRQKPYGPTGQCTRRSWRGLCWRTRSRALPSDLGTVTDGANKIEIQKKAGERGGAKKRVRTLSRSEHPRRFGHKSQTRELVAIDIIEI